MGRAGSCGGSRRWRYATMARSAEEPPHRRRCSGGRALVWRACHALRVINEPRTHNDLFCLVRSRRRTPPLGGRSLCDRWRVGDRRPAAWRTRCRRGGDGVHTSVGSSTSADAVARAGRQATASEDSTHDVDGTFPRAAPAARGLVYIITS